MPEASSFETEFECIMRRRSAMIDAEGLMRTDLTVDDLHPNAAGYAIMAPLAEAAIARALK